MKLSIDQEEQSRPQSLTENLFITLMAAEIKRKAVFQIISFTRKREQVYSTKLSDGFFVVKAMIVSQAASQIQNGCIKVYSILEGWIRNHGDGVIVVKQTIKFWDYDCAVGDTKAWKLKKQNINNKGSSVIFWDKNPLMSSTVSLLDKGESLDSLKQAGDLQNDQKMGKDYRHLLSSQKQINIQKSSQENIQSIELKQAEIQINPKIKQVESSDCQLQRTQSMQLHNRQPKQDELGTTQPPKKTKIDQILQLILSDTDDQQQTNSKMHASEQKQIKQPSNTKKSQKKIDLKFIFDNLDEQTFQTDPQTHFQQQQNKQTKIDRVQDQEDSFAVWMQNRSKLKCSPKLQVSQKTQSQKKRRMQQYLELQTQLSNLLEEAADDQRSGLQQLSSLYPADKMISVSDIYHGLSVSSTAYWWTRLFIICLDYKTQDEDYIQGIVSDESKKYLMSSVFTNVTDCKVELREGCQYRFTKANIRYLLQNFYNGCNYQFQFNCKQSHMIEEQSEYDFQQNCSNYCPLQKIQEIDEGLLVNVFGVLKNFKTLKAKSGVSYNYELVDPLSKYSVNLIHFQSHFCSQYIKDCIKKGMAAYGVQVGSFKGKTNLTLKPSSIIKFQWLPHTTHAMQIREWIDHGNNIMEVQTELLGFVDAAGLRDIDEETSNNIHILNATVIEFKDKFTYRACNKCLKKVEEPKCKFCGNNQIFDRVFLRGSLGDWSATVNVVWSQSAAQKMLAEGFQSMQSTWLLKQVELWIQKGNNGILTIIRMRLISSNQRVSDLLSQINKHLI